MSKMMLYQKVSKRLLIWAVCLLTTGIAASALINKPAWAKKGGGGPVSCESLLGAQLPGNTTVQTAQTLVGDITLTDADGHTSSLTGMPEFCRVTGVTKPGPNSDVNWEVWMPAEGWNGRFEQIGGGGIDGSIRITTLGPLMQQGYAAAATDGGSTGQFADFVNNVDRQLDFAYRAFPATRNIAIHLIQDYYSSKPTYSYFVGCSEGGREALLMAQRYPHYFDGIQAGSPAKYPPHMWIGNNIWLDQLFSNPDNALSLTQIKTIERASTAACAAPGTGVVADPRLCKWDVSTLLCTGSNTPASGTCLSAPQVSTMKQVLGRFGGAHNPRTNQMIFPGVNPFSGIDGLFPGSTSSDSHILYIGSLFYNNLTWPWKGYNFDSDQSALDALREAAALETINPDLSAFAAHGGKLIMWVGWEDPQIFVWDTLNFYEYMIHANALNDRDRRLLNDFDWNPEYPYRDKYFGPPLPTTPDADAAAHDGFWGMDKQAIEAYEHDGFWGMDKQAMKAYEHALDKTKRTAMFYMAPGVNHCGGASAPGAESFVTAGNQGEVTQALRNWVEKGVAPGAIQISKQQNNSATGATVFTTLLCPYPETLTYKGSGDLLSASSYQCVMPSLATINGR